MNEFIKRCVLLKAIFILYFECDIFYSIQTSSFVNMSVLLFMFKIGRSFLPDCYYGSLLCTGVEVDMCRYWCVVQAVEGVWSWLVGSLLTRPTGACQVPTPPN